MALRGPRGVVVKKRLFTLADGELADGDVDLAFDDRHLTLPFAVVCTERANRAFFFKPSIAAANWDQHITDLSNCQNEDGIGSWGGHPEVLGAPRGAPNRCLLGVNDQCSCFQPPINSPTCATHRSDCTSRPCITTYPQPWHCRCCVTTIE